MLKLILGRIFMLVPRHIETGIGDGWVPVCEHGSPYYCGWCGKIPPDKSPSLELEGDISAYDDVMY